MVIELNPKFKQALKLLENTTQNIFITGKAGTGKSTLLDYFRNHTKKNVVVLASTGVAAVNIQGQTVHSFFGFKPDISVDKIPRIVSRFRNVKIFDEMEMIIIDEISMVRADLLDHMNLFLKKRLKTTKPFGGVQMVFIGDLYQLPPVLTAKDKKAFKELYQNPYFFSSKVAQQSNFKFELLELEKIYRQTDQTFIDILNKIRNGSVTQNDLEIVNKRVNRIVKQEEDDFSIYITTTNDLADSINQEKLNQLNTKEFTFLGMITGRFQSKDLPTAEILTIKPKSQVMLLNNDSLGRWINGTIGKIIKISSIDGSKDPTIDNYLLYVKLDSGRCVKVKPFTWKIFQYKYNPRTKQIETETTGTFTQFPVRLSWAITIHKSQGKTFENVILDIGRGTFTPGQAYVAISRCRALAGLTLKKALMRKHIWTDWKVSKFLTDHQYQKAHEKLTIDEIKDILRKAIERKKKVKITYLKTDNTKSTREISPYKLGKLEYLGKSYFGVEAYCHSRNAERNFRIDRILEIC